jgi:hypothetical protein
MSSKWEYHDGLWQEVIVIRDPWCQICGRPIVEAHHIFGRTKDWEIRYDTDYGAGLCHGCHFVAPYAPEKSNELFFEKLIPILMQKDEVRALKILVYKNSIRKPQTLPPPWPKMSRNLRAARKAVEATAWMDYDCEPNARGAYL